MDTYATLTDQLLHHLRANSGLEQHRAYLGMSAISECPLELYRRFLGGQTLNDRAHAFCYLGYLFERDCKARLLAIGQYVAGSERELVAPWDARFQGHTDGETAAGDLLEIKSVSENRLLRIRQDEGRLPNEHFYQVQTYLRYGPYERALVVYVCRETFEHYAVVAPRREAVGLAMEDKARRILAAVDSGRPPQCECGRCHR